MKSIYRRFKSLLKAARSKHLKQLLKFNQALADGFAQAIRA